MTFQVELWHVILLFIAVVGYLLNTQFIHENRITKIETSSAYIINSLDEIKETIKENCTLIKNHILGEDKDEQ